jgi:cobalamin biosynthetic protein CobC
MGEAVELAGFRRHGGRLGAARAAFPRAPEPWLDLSTGINPRPYPARPPPLQARARLPDPEALQALEAAAAAHFGAPRERVAAVPGSEAAIRLLPHLLDARRVAIAPDTYGGHAESWRAAGAELTAEPHAADAWVVVNPNNPDGRITARAALLAAARERWTIVDEAFVEPTPETSVAAAALDQLIVLRSFGKFFGLAGVRLGFVIADAELIARLRQRLGDWPIAADALSAGLAAYADGSWIVRTRARLARDAARLQGVLAAAGLRPAGGTDLFRLVEAPDAAGVFRRLAAAGVLCRLFDHPHRLRFGLPGRAQDFRRLAAALSGDVP